MELYSYCRNLGVAKTLSLFLFFCVINRKVAETCGTILYLAVYGGHLLLYLKT